MDINLRGIEEKRINPPVKNISKYFCSICKLLPYKIKICQNIKYFCEDCITNHLLSSKLCYVCKDNYVEVKNEGVMDYLNAFVKIECENRDNGCNDVLSYEEIRRHENEC